VTGAGELIIRRATPDDEPQVLQLLAESLGWLPDGDHLMFFRWKHQENPFGRSPAWVAVDGDRIAGYRTFLRWRFLSGGERVSAVRAVDTATHPEYQGRGIFSKLTLRALEEMREEGVAFVFNTPNDQSRPGYLKMGWRLVRTLPVGFRPRNPSAAVRLLRARVPAGKWSLPTKAGIPALDAAQDDHLDQLLASTPDDGMRTDRSREYFAWRYGLPALAYRAMPLGDSIADGVVFFRLRRRGPAIEAAICDVLLRTDASRQLRHAVTRILRTTGADYAVSLDTRLGAGFLRLPIPGPTLVWRDLAETEMRPADSWDLALGDVELC
jgi:GNAT superfamily N-acetyltransferase